MVGTTAECRGSDRGDFPFSGGEVRQAGGEFVGDAGHRGGPYGLVALVGVGFGGRAWIGGLQTGVGFLDPLSGVGDAGQDARFVLQVGRLWRGGLRVSAALFEGSARVFDGAVEGDGVAAQAQRHGDGYVVFHRAADRDEGGETATDDLGDGDQVDLVFRAVGVEGFECGHSGEGKVAAGGKEEHRGEERDDQMGEDVGGAEGVVVLRVWCLGRSGGLGHWGRTVVWGLGLYTLFWNGCRVVFPIFRCDKGGQAGAGCFGIGALEREGFNTDLYQRRWLL